MHFPQPLCAISELVVLFASFVSQPQSSIRLSLQIWIRFLSPTIEALSEQYEGQAKVGKLNVDENSETAAAYGISSIPAVLLFDKGKVVERFVGIQPRERYEAALTALSDVASETI